MSKEALKLARAELSTIRDVATTYDVLDIATRAIAAIDAAQNQPAQAVEAGWIDLNLSKRFPDSGETVLTYSNSGLIQIRKFGKFTFPTHIHVVTHWMPLPPIPAQTEGSVKMTDMTVAEAAEILRKHNEWRRGDFNDDPQPPSSIGKALDVAVAFMTAKPDGWLTRTVP